MASWRRDTEQKLEAIKAQRAETVRAFLEAKGEMEEAASDHTKCAVGIRSTRPPPSSTELELADA
jgi:hypothetical protein